MKVGISFFLVLLTTVFGSSCFAQTISVGTPVLEEEGRRMQVKGKTDLLNSFTIRPIYGRYDSISHLESLFPAPKKNSTISFAKGRSVAHILPVTIKQQYNTHHPYGWNDGSMIPARGYQNQLSFGFYSRIGPLSVQIQPEVVFAQNRNFNTFPSTHSDSIWKSYYNVLNRIDNPEKYGNGSYARLFPGQSSIRLNAGKLSLGVSTENLWWGPGVRNALVMSNNAPGFRHISFNTTSPVVSPIGSFEWQIVSGILQNSGIIPADTSRTFNGQGLYLPKRNSDRYLNGMVITWQPKWTRGLNLGFSRVFYQYRPDVAKSLNGCLPVLSSFFKKNALDENSIDGRDQLLSLFLRLVLPESRAELYAEYGRNDHSGDSRDLILEPEHARAYIIGARKLFDAGNQKEVELFMELTQLQKPATMEVREQEGWYTHYQIRHGYTNLGQVIGAGIGPGGSSQSIGLNWIKNIKKFGILLERVVHNNDFYYDAFGPKRDYQSHWVDLSINLNRNWTHKQFIYSADLTWIKSFNYEWQKGEDVNNLHAGISISYLF